jgi:hypothetical protein
MFTSIYAAIGFTAVFTILLFLARHEAYGKGEHDGWFAGFDEARSSYSDAYYDGYDDYCKIGRNEYDKGYDDGWWEGNRDGLQLGKEWGYEEGYTDGRAITTQIRGPVFDQLAVELERATVAIERGLAGSTDDDETINLDREEAELRAAERLMEALA